MAKYKWLLIIAVLLLRLPLFAQTEKSDSTVANPATAKDTVPLQIEEYASFPGGMDALFKFLNKNLKYPARAIDASITGVVYVQFVVEVDGQLTNITIKKGVHHLLDSAAMQAVAMMPPWIPGKINGKPVRSMYVLPVQFELASDDKPADRQRRGRRK